MSNARVLFIALAFSAMLGISALLLAEYEQGLPVAEDSEDLMHFRLFNPHPYRMFCIVYTGAGEFTANIYPGKYSAWFPRVGRMNWSCRS